MAKTRSQSRSEKNVSIPPVQKQKSLSSNLSRNLKCKKSKSQPQPVMKSCRVRLTRIDPKNIDLINARYNEAKKTGTKQLSMQYELRKRATSTVLSAPVKKTRAKPLNQIVALSQYTLHTSRAIRLWDEIKKKSMSTLKINDIVCARMAGHRPWPGKVMNFDKKGTRIYFYGTHEEGYVKKAEIVPYELVKSVLEEYLHISCSSLCSKTLIYHMSFLKAVKELTCDGQTC